MKVWIIKRYLIEEFEVEAETRDAAFGLNVYNPSKISIIKETCKLKQYKNSKP